MADPNIAQGLKLSYFHCIQAQGRRLWNLVTSSLDRNLINLRCACGTCAETKKNVLDCTREPPCWNLDSLCTRCVLLSVAVPFCSITVRSL